MSDTITEKGETDFGVSELNRNGMTFTVGPTGTAEASSADPWSEAEKRHPVGSKVSGRIVNFKPYGFFVETKDGYFGLVHGSQIEGWNWKRRFDSIFSLGDEVTVTVNKIDAETRRMAFGYELTPEQKTELDTEKTPPPPPPPPPTHAEIAAAWTAEHPDRSEAAKAWLLTELEDGPLYGPLASVLNERFDVPLPVSHWVRQFAEFSCFAGRDDNPSGLPAVALLARAGDAEYWKRFKQKSSEMTENVSQEGREKVRLGEVAAKIAGLDAFPGSVWIRHYGETAAGLARAGVPFGKGDTIERLVVPMLGELGWKVAQMEPTVLVRGSHGQFDLRLCEDDGKLAVAVVCERAGTAFRSLHDCGANVQTLDQRNVIERVLAICNGEKGYVEGGTKVVWTNGTEWIVFSSSVLVLRVGILSDRKGEALLEQTKESDANDVFTRLAFPSGDRLLDWLETFADLRSLIGREN